MNYDEIQNEINELEEAIAECDFGSSSYDYLNAEIESLYLKRDRLKKDQKKAKKVLTSSIS
jgi:hypothetical protein